MNYRQIAGALCSVVFGATLLAGTANASCVDLSAAVARMSPTAYVSTNSGPAIVGLWKFQMISKSLGNHVNPMPDGTLIDFGTAVWHADGTELQTSGMRNPSDGDVCQGVWQQTSASTFNLNHYALAWTNGAYTGPVNIRAWVTVAPDGNHYAGQFVTTVYLASTVIGHQFDETRVLASITGTFTADRVTMSN